MFIPQKKTIKTLEMMQTNEQMKRDREIIRATGKRENEKTVAMSIQKEIIVLQSTYSQFIYFIFGSIHYTSS